MAGINETLGWVEEAGLAHLSGNLSPQAVLALAAAGRFETKLSPFIHSFIHSLNCFQRLLHARSCAGVGWG